MSRRRTQVQRLRRVLHVRKNERDRAMGRVREAGESLISARAIERRAWGEIQAACEAVAGSVGETRSVGQVRHLYLQHEDAREFHAHTETECVQALETLDDVRRALNEAESSVRVADEALTRALDELEALATKNERMELDDLAATRRIRSERAELTQEVA